MAALSSTEVLAVFVQFKARVEARLRAFKDPHSERRAPVRFTQAIPYDFKGSFPVLYVVEKDIVQDDSLFGAHSVVAPETANELRNIMMKRKRGDDSEDEAAAGAAGAAGTGDASL